MFPGEEQELAALRRWLTSLLPRCPAHNDVLIVANELASNALGHTASRGTWFAVEITWHESEVQVAVADCGGPAEDPRPVYDPEAEHGRGLMIVQGLSVRSGHIGDQRGRLAWARVSWDGPGPSVLTAAHDGYQAAVRDGERALARNFAGVPSWFGHSTLTWWALTNSAGLVSAPTQRDLAERLQRLLSPPAAPEQTTAGRTYPGRAARPAPVPGRQGDTSISPRPGTAGTRPVHLQQPGRPPGRRLTTAPTRLAIGTAALAGA